MVLLVLVVLLTIADNGAGAGACCFQMDLTKGSQTPFLKTWTTKCLNWGLLFSNGPNQRLTNPFFEDMDHKMSKLGLLFSNGPNQRLTNPFFEDMDHKMSKLGLVVFKWT